MPLYNVRDEVKRWWGLEIREAAGKHGLDFEVVVALVCEESAGLASAYRYEKEFWIRYLAGKQEWRDQNPKRVAASYGLMQVMYPTALEMGYPKAAPPEGLFVPELNLDLGCKYLHGMLWRFGGSIRTALAAYNGGPGNYGGQKAQQYADRVLRLATPV
jgi:hypothetical protein